MTRASLLLALIVLTACSTRTGTLPRQDGGNDVDMNVSDLGLALDAGNDASAQDAGPDAATLIDSGSDAGALDAGSECDYIPWNPFLVSCSTGYEDGVSYLNSSGSTEMCPEYFIFMSHTAESAEGAVAMVEGCDASCVYTATSSADGVYCGLRFSVDDLHAAAGDEVCPPLYVFGGGPPDSEGNRGGIYSSSEEYEAEHPCPDIGEPHDPIPPID